MFRYSLSYWQPVYAAGRKFNNNIGHLKFAAYRNKYPSNYDIGH